MVESIKVDELVVPSYDHTHTRPIIGYGNFGNTSPTKSDSTLLNPRIVERKFAMWDYVMKHNLLESKDPKVRSKAIRLLRDKTILAYANLKFDGKPIKMMALQDAILSDKNDRVIFCGCNQHIGKSFTLNVDAATDFLIDHGKNWIGIIVSGSLPQSQFQMDRIKQLLKSGNVDYKTEETTETKTGKRDNTTQITYTFYDDHGKPLYMNRLICCPHTSSALGYPANCLWLDEWDFWDNCDQDHFLYQIAIPRTFRTKGKIKVFSNPDGQEKNLYKLWKERKPDGDPAWHRYHFNYWDKPSSNQAEFDKLIIGMTKTRIESTLLAVFTRTQGSFFSKQEIDDMYNEELSQKGDSAGYGKETAWFLDIGSVHDQSVLIGGYVSENNQVPDMPIINAFWIHKYPVGYPLARVVGVDSAIDSEDGWEDYVIDNPSVKEVLSQYSEDVQGKKYQPLFGYDATGNAGMKPLFATASVDAIDITFTGKLKWHMYQRYQYYVQQRFLKRGKERDANTVRGCTFNYQASKLIVKKGTKTTYRQIHHENENDLDDTQDTMAGFIHLIENPNLSTLDFQFIPHGDPQQKNVDLEGQYVPSWMSKSELNNWMSTRKLR